MLADALQVRYIGAMKTATIPSIRVEPELRSELESVLREGESLSEFVEASVRASVQRRQLESEFVSRGLRSLSDARRTGDYVDAEAVLEKLQRKLDSARASRQKSRK
jgi:predicted transcriptional regulator